MMSFAPQDVGAREGTSFIGGEGACAGEEEGEVVGYYYLIRRCCTATRRKGDWTCPEVQRL